jgi:hypothetical protein
MPHVILEFIGGAWDGMNLSNQSADAIEVKLALQTYEITVEGSQGKAVVMPADYALRKTGIRGYEYVVRHRIEIGDEVLVRLECLAADLPETTNISGPQEEKTAIMLQFEGGHLGGRLLSTASPEVCQALLAAAYYWITGEGTVGNGFDGMPIVWDQSWKPTLEKDRPAFRRDHEYRVIERTESQGRILVRLAYLPKRP